MINLIVAISKNGCIGKEGKLPWYYPEDLKYFKEKTQNNIVVMGGNTFFNSLEAKPLPGRTNYVLSKKRLEFYNPNYENLYIISDFKLVKELIKRTKKEVFIIGGLQIYELFLSMVERYYITYIEEEIQGDTFLNLNLNNFKLIQEKPSEHNNIKFRVYENIN